MSWPTIIALGVLAIAVPGGICGAVCMWRLGRDLDRDRRNEYRTPPQWLNGMARK